MKPVSVAVFVTLASYAYGFVLPDPWGEVSDDAVSNFGDTISDNMVGFMNKEYGIEQYRQLDGNPGWSKQLISVIDGLEFTNYGRFVQHLHSIRNAFTSFRKTTDANTTIIDDDTLSINYCIEAELGQSFGFAYTQPIGFCLDIVKHFGNMREKNTETRTVWKYELRSNNDYVSDIFSFAVTLISTTIASQLDIGRDFDATDGGYRVWANPVVLSAWVVIIAMTFTCAMIAGCVVTKRNHVKNVKYEAVRQESDASEMSA